jgi:hypothetical protein
VVLLIWGSEFLEALEVFLLLDFTASRASMELHPRSKGGGHFVDGVAVLSDGGGALLKGAVFYWRGRGSTGECRLF